MTPPKTLIEMTLFIELRKKSVSEYHSKAEEFTLISDNVKVLGTNNLLKQYFSAMNIK